MENKKIEKKKNHTMYLFLIGVLTDFIWQNLLQRG